MSNEFENLGFTEQQKSYFLQRVAEEVEKAGQSSVNVARTPEEKAIKARETGDYLALQNDKEAKHAFIDKFGSRAYGELNDRHLKAERARKAEEERAQRLAEQKARRSRI